MKIGIMIDRLNVGGVEKIAIEQVKALRSIGVDASLVVLREKGVVEDAFTDLLKDVPVDFLDKRLNPIFRFSFSFPLFHFFSSFHVTYPLVLPFVVKKNEFDYFISHGTYTSLTAMSLRKFRKIRYSAFIWDPASYILDRVYSDTTFKPLFWALKKVAAILDKALIKSMDIVLVGGPAHNDFIKKLDPTKKIKVIYPSVHPIKKILKKQNYVLMATAWKRGKNPEYILEVAKNIPNIKIKMVGIWLEQAYREEFEVLRKEKNLINQIEIVGEVTEEELSNAYSRAMVVLQTNDDRGFGMPALEAAGRGTTFIIPKGQGVCKLFENNKDGYYTKEKDTKTIVKLLKEIMGNPEKATSMGASAWKKVKENYSWEKHAIALSDEITAITK